MSKKDTKKSMKSQEEPKSKVNFEDLIINNQSAFKMVADNSGYYFTQLNLSSKSLDSLGSTFNNYKYMEQIDLSSNNLGDFAILSNMQFLIRLNLENNSIKDLKSLGNEEAFKSLRYLNLASNKLVELTPIKVQLLELNLKNNKIEKMETFDGNAKLRMLQLRNNKIQTLAQFVGLPELKILKLRGNRIKSIAGLEQLLAIQQINLRENQIEVFDETFPALENLQHLDLRKNLIDKYEEVAKLTSLVALKRLYFSENPFEKKNPNYLLDTINLMVRLERINNIFVTKQLKLKAFNYAEDKYEKDQELKRIQEEEERLKQEQPQD